MRRPRVGINSKYVEEEGSVYYKLDRRYVEAIWRAGGEPHVWPVMRARKEVRARLAQVEGVMMTGGADLHSRAWDAQVHPKARLLHPDKQRSDLWLAEETWLAGKPLFSICLGAQVVNVARGGTLIQHLADLPAPNGAHREGKGRHPVRVAQGSRLHDILGRTKVSVNSFHHQAVGDVGKGLHVNAVSDDGVIEGTEDPRGSFLLNVQWHPERMDEEVVQRRLFRAFVAGCR